MFLNYIVIIFVLSFKIYLTIQSDAFNVQMYHNFIEPLLFFEMILFQEIHLFFASRNPKKQVNFS